VSTRLGISLQTLAEKAAWEISKKEGFELVVINPTLVLGKSTSPQ
jgi:hypothetical protein